MIKAFTNFEELNKFLRNNNCVVRAIDPGVTRIYLDFEETAGTENSQVTKKMGNVATIVEEIINLKLADRRYEIPYYNKYKGCALVDYIRSYENAETLLAVVIAGLDCNESEAKNLRLCLAGEKFDSFYCK